MGWLYLPGSEDLNSDWHSSSHQSELWLTLNGNPSLRPFSWRGWKNRPFIRLLYGMMLQPSQVKNLEEKWISSLPDSHANHSLKQDCSKEKKMIDGYGTISKKSFAQWNQNSCSWRTCQVSLTGDLIPFSGRYPPSGSMQNGRLYERPKVDPLTSENGYLFWDSSPNGSKNYINQSDMLPTPNAKVSNDGESLESFIERKRKTKELTGANNGIPLSIAVQMLPTPDASSHKYRLEGDSQQSKSLMSRTGGKLNPQFVEWMMGWPIGWTGLDPVGTELSRFKQLMHSALWHVEQSESNGQTSLMEWI